MKGFFCLCAVAAVLVVCVLQGSAIAGGCKQFFVQRQVAYYQPYVAYAPQVLYQAGRDIEAEALAEKIALKVEQRLALRQQQTAQSQQRASLTVLQAKCVRCHNPSKANGGLVLDGSEAVPDSAYRRFHKMAGLGEDVPPEMEKVIASLTVEEKGKLTEEMLRLEPRPQAVPVEEPPAAPVPSRNGDLE